MKEHDRNPAGFRPSDRRADDPGRVALPAMTWFSEHREEVRGGRPASPGSRLDLHDPHATARDRFPCDLHDETDETSRAHAIAGPSTVDCIRGIVIASRELGDRLPHRTAVSNQEIEVPRGGGSDDRSDHAAGLKTRVIRLPGRCNLKQG